MAALKNESSRNNVLKNALYFLKPLIYMTIIKDNNK